MTPRIHSPARRHQWRSVLAYGAGPALGLLSGPVLARALGPDGRGQFAAVMQPLTLGSAIAAIGVPTAVTYFVASRSRDVKSAQRLALAIAAPFTALVLTALAWYATRISANHGLDTWAVLTAWTLVIASVVIQVRRAAFTGLGDWRRLDAERLCFAVTRFLAVCALALLGVTAAMAYVAAALAAFALAAIILWLPPAPAQDATAKRASANEFAAYSLAASTGTIALVCSSRIDQVLMPLQTTTAQLGYYAIAVTVAEVPLIFATLAARDTLKLTASGVRIGAALVAVRLYLAGGIAVATVLGIFAPAYVPWIFGAAFRPSISAVQILSAATVLAIGAVAAAAILQGVKRPGLASLVPLAGFSSTALLFALSWGAVDARSAAIITVASQALSLAVGAVLVIAVGRRRAGPVTTGTQSSRANTGGRL
ncbi:lipopolysaccharide biosynthesis protein [Demequina globuliformis]|uniref:lipopolysaccharide biosynthesis protein n=1 Tax=Demequina globuliformis TaxID=676202 RepID=UPI00078236D9|nr:oligosaccharide flippase family protein [Demequina globuliformis]